MTNFRTGEAYLNERLFKTGRSRYGMESTCLNVHYLPDFMAYTKQSLSEKQRICLIDYELESLLMELATLRASEISGMNQVGLLRTFVVNLLRSNSNFWVRNSTIWNEIQGKREDLEVGLKAMETYIGQTKKPLFVYQSEQPQLKTFQPIIPKLVTNNCQKFTCSQPNNIYQRISLKLLLHLKQYLQTVIRPTQELQLQHFLIDFLFCSEKRRKKKKQPIDWSVQRNDEWMIFTKYVGEEHLSACLNDINVEQIIITNMIKAHRNKIMNAPSDGQFSDMVSTIENVYWAEEEAATIYACWLKQYNANAEKYQIVDRLNKQRAGILIPGCTNTIEEIESVCKSWVSLQDNPDFKNLSRYKFHSEKRKEWEPNDYRKFLEGLLLYFDQPVNNRKIAQHINKDFEPNHVKHVKGIYLRNLKQRMDNGECGGGQFGDCLSKKEFITKDLENFNVKWFSKTKLAKKRRKLADSDQASSSWECR